MKITITYRRTQQIGPDAWDCWTEVVHLKQSDTISEIYNRCFRGKWTGSVDVELHIDVNDD